MGQYDFVAASGIEAGISADGTTLYQSPETFFLTDGVIFVGANPFLAEGGLLFSAGGTEFNFFYSSGSYLLFGSNGFGPTGNRLYNPLAEGTATLTAVPESGMTVVMLGAALMGFAAFRRRFAR